MLDAPLLVIMTCAIICTDVDGVITTFDHGAEQLLGYRADDLVGYSTPLLLHDQAEIRTRAKELGIEPGFGVVVTPTRRGVAEDRQWTYLGRTGARIPVRLHVSAIQDSDDAHSGFVCVATDLKRELRVLAEARAAEGSWRTLLDHLPDTSVLVIGADMRYRLAVGAGLTRHGLTDITGKSPADISTPQNATLVEPLIRAALSGTAGTLELTDPGTKQIHLITAAPLPARDGQPEALVLARDVSADRAREAALRAAQQHAAQLFNDAPHGILVLDLTGTITDANPALCRELGRPHNTLVGESYEGLVGNTVGTHSAPDDLTNLISVITGQDGRVSGQTRLVHADGHFLDVAYGASMLRDPHGVSQSILVNVVDVTERHQREQELAHLASHDPLTSLANRRHFSIALIDHLDRCAGSAYRGAMMMLDLDHFKHVNDTRGHDAGDALLVAMASILRAHTCGRDIAARLGGDEFVVLLPDADEVKAEKVAAAIIDRVRAKLGSDDACSASVTTSIGVVMITEIHTSPTHLLAAADQAMYQAKNSGRDRYHLHQPDSVGTPLTAQPVEPLQPEQRRKGPRRLAASPPAPTHYGNEPHEPDITAQSITANPGRSNRTEVASSTLVALRRLDT